jgi:ferredoxin
MKFVAAMDGRCADSIKQKHLGGPAAKTTGKILRRLAPGICFSSSKIMADVANRYPENLPGKFYVDNQCIDCDLCRETAPSNFGRNDDGGYSYVYKQPISPEEEKLCKEAMEGCPVEAIGDNGS